MLPINDADILYFKENFEMPRYFGKNLDTEEYLDGTYEAMLPFIQRGFKLFSGVSKAALVNDRYAIKIPFFYKEEAFEDYDAEEDKYYENYDLLELEWDYCEKELELYNEIAAAGFSCFVAETVALEGTPAIIQEVVHSYNSIDDITKYEASKETLAKAKKYIKTKIYRYRINEEIYATFIEHYGEELTNAFVQWCGDNHPEITDDLHRGNWGWRPDGTPALLDFCGYEG